MGGSLSNSKVILLLVCQGTGTCFWGDGMWGGFRRWKPSRVVGDILKWSKGLIPSGTWQGLYQSYYLTMLHLHSTWAFAPSVFSWGWITACEEVCCGMLKMKEPLKSNRHCTALSSLVDTSSLRAGPIVWKGSLKCMAKWCPARFLLDLCYFQLGWSAVLHLVEKPWLPHRQLHVLHNRKPKSNILQVWRSFVVTFWRRRMDMVAV